MQRLVWALALVTACGSSTSTSPATTDGGADVAHDALPDVPADAPRVLCPNSAPDGGPTLCAPGMICGNSGGVPGNFCCYPQPGMPDYYCPG